MNLADDLSELLKPICALRKIHEDIVLDLESNSNLVCSATLISRLHGSLANAKSKLDHDLRLTLFLESLQHYLAVIDFWFAKNDFSDYSNEFPINKLVFNC